MTSWQPDEDKGFTAEERNDLLTWMWIWALVILTCAGVLYFALSVGEIAL